jgi:hypothetical protein
MKNIRRKLLSLFLVVKTSGLTIVELAGGSPGDREGLARMGAAGGDQLDEPRWRLRTGQPGQS